MSNPERDSSERTTYFYTASAALHRPVSALTTLPHKVDATISLSGGNKSRQSNELKRTSYTLGRLPYVTPWYPKSYSSSDVPPDFSWLSESCGSKAAIGIFGGAVCGLLMGVFLGAMSDMTPPVTVINGKEVPTAPLKEQMRTTMRATGDKCIYWSRNFAFITGVFGGAECLVEKYRGKHDVWNSAIGGCVTGAALQAKQGPQAAAIGCGGFAVFSLVIDNVFPH
mmetsp:Transcript_17100/g.49083  ORF Transcript_17100/g.49083 Transcript_17100/m.49083 type:complete len:225 (+) Transcript_17100:91-765(+)|eukprot:CAMPEP_0181028876 /NCGR_PEP_ID=MMETSP1070-20121207/4899_1 /TAXON_ID=265543 /ORGANISM="Minutocellus polymorphus, Strain NH13" /LENGTH=224 /DNA_ID=CAMNT_0023106149 /DNA_START=50 /DNA_END=724 /DNA_ORIENTATION=-